MYHFDMLYCMTPYQLSQQHITSTNLPYLIFVSNINSCWFSSALVVPPALLLSKNIII